MSALVPNQSLRHGNYDAEGRGAASAWPMRTLTGEGILIMSRAIRMLVAATAVGGLALSGLITAGAASAAVNGLGTHGPGSWHVAPGTRPRYLRDRRPW